ncbi:hypothetical protein GJ496_002832 [Pomphorhynchus laevis]|nr:hypothetical protein GJ496_002832 [Pomphorhynchus laevis]
MKISPLVEDYECEQKVNSDDPQISGTINNVLATGGILTANKDIDHDIYDQLIESMYIVVSFQGVPTSFHSLCDASKTFIGLITYKYIVIANRLTEQDINT